MLIDPPLLSPMPLAKLLSMIHGLVGDYCSKDAVTRRMRPGPRRAPGWQHSFGSHHTCPPRLLAPLSTNCPVPHEL